MSLIDIIKGWIEKIFGGEGPDSTELPAPTVTQVVPKYGPNNAETTITIMGQNFADGAKVFLDTLAGATTAEDARQIEATWQSDTQIQAVVPANFVPKHYEIVVRNPDGQEATYLTGFEVKYPPEPDIPPDFDRLFMVGEVATFDASSSSDPDSTQLQYEWDFGDGKTGTGVQPSHAWTKAGDYNVTLKVTDETGLSSSLTFPVTISAEPNIDETTYVLDPADYYDDKYHKDLIVLHFTAGSSARGAYSTFAKRGHVATAFIIGRDGAIYELFDRKCWAYHLGMRSGNSGHKHDKRSIAIEVVNVGPLKEADDNPNQLNWWPPEDEFCTKWCTKDETNKYKRVSDRGIDYYATFTDAQYISIKRLLTYLCAKYNIPMIAPSDKLKTDVDGLANFKGIIAHQHYRQDKYDMGPAFKWDRIGLA